MERTNIYLNESQLRMLRQLGEQRDSSVAALVREALNSWLESQGVRLIEEDEWQRRFKSLLDRRRRIAGEDKPSEGEIERDVKQAILEVRKARAARSR